MDPRLLDLPLGVKIPVLPGSKPVFCRAKLGEKVNEAERGRKALFFYGVPVIQRRGGLVATCSTAGAAALQSHRAGEAGEHMAPWCQEEGGLAP